VNQIRLTLKELNENISFNVTGSEANQSFSTRVRGVSVNLEKHDYAIFLGPDSHLLEPFESIISKSQFRIKRLNIKGIRIHGRSEKHALIKGYHELLDLVDECEIDGLGYGRQRSPFFMDGLRKEFPFSLAAAKKIKVLLDNQMGHLIRHCARAILYADEQDHAITKGHSEKATDYREHVVPCIMIAEKAAELTYNGASEQRVADFIMQHLVIVRICKSEAIIMDKTLNLKDRMPKGWQWGDTIYARLLAANIKYSITH
jgi:hypothetical protein